MGLLGLPRLVWNLQRNRLVHLTAEEISLQPPHEIPEDHLP
jgi:hypothetical protein